MNRRTLLKTASTLPLLTLPTPAPTAERAVRFAYIGDTHIRPDPKPMLGVQRCLHHIQNQTDKPAFILHGGDIIMDALVENKERVRAQWEAWQQVLKSENSLPIEYAIGNHDIWGFEKDKSDPVWGKKWVIDQLQLKGRYYSFDRGGWHFVVLDSIQPKADGAWYQALMDEEQRTWLKADLQKTPATTPVLLLSHVPILSTTVLTFTDSPASHPNVQIMGGLLHADAGSLIELLYQFPNVKAALSGHTHLLDQTTYNNLTYYCNGAVSGNWWTTAMHRQTPAGYALFDLFTDGTINRTYVSYER